MNKKTFGTIAIVAALAAVLAVPVFAQAGRGNGDAHGRDKTVIAAKKAQAKAKAKAKVAVKKAKNAVNRGRRSGEASDAVKPKGQRQAQLEKRISNKLAARKHRFDAVNANLTARIGRLAVLTTRVAAAGGDVSAVNAKLDIARQHLANALALEQAAIAKFQAVPTATGRHAAFVEARAAGRAAVAELKLARVAIRDAAASLRVVVRGLHSETASETVDAQ